MPRSTRTTWKVLWPARHHWPTTNSTILRTSKARGERLRRRRLSCGLHLYVGVAFVVSLHFLIPVKFIDSGFSQNFFDRLTFSRLMIAFENGSSTSAGHSISGSPIDADQMMNRIFHFSDATDSAKSSSPELLIVAGKTKCFRGGTAEVRSDDVTAIVAEKKLTESTETRSAAGASHSNCTCKPDWYGKACSIPGVVWRSDTPWPKKRLRLRTTPRRVVMAFPFSVEFDMLDLRFAELGDIVDVFAILESNYTAYGRAKPLHLLQRILNGTYEPDIVSKILYVPLDYFPDGAHKDGWIADGLLRNHIGTHGLPRVRGLRPDDLLVLNDADEVPSRAAIQFLRWHDGYSEPVLLRYLCTLYGFFWKPQWETQQLPSVVTMGMVAYVFRFQVYQIRSAKKFIDQHAFDVKLYVGMSLLWPASRRRQVAAWTLGSGPKDTAGWHCSWCLHPEGIAVKLVSAQNGDFPRWGDKAEKCNTTYIAHLIATGTWFDDVQRMIRVESVTGPRALLSNPDRYRHLIENAYEKMLILDELKRSQELEALFA